ncbi:hypothetical protein H1R20_g7202, partial [Candolleomyces eurysporus]
MASNFNNAQNFQIDNYQFMNVNASVDPLSKLQAQIAAGAIHDSRERYDAPKCQPETRVAVQDDLYAWIVEGDGESERPRNVKWVTGPAGTGKTAVMGITGRSLARHREDLQTAISTAVEKNPDVFEKNLHVQMETLVLSPLREVVCQSDGPGLRGAIIIDGLDECEAEQYHDTTSSNTQSKPARKNAEDQLEILQVLHAASSDPSFPFRIIIASRPERVFREFFDPENNPTPFAHKLDLNEDYNANADITLFLEAQFNLLRRRYHFLPSWPPPGTIQTLVENASGQFIYAATVIRFLEAGHREPPKALLDAILTMGSKSRSSPFGTVDLGYQPAQFKYG